MFETDALLIKLFRYSVTYYAWRFPNAIPPANCPMRLAFPSIKCLRCFLLYYAWYAPNYALPVQPLYSACRFRPWYHLSSIIFILANLLCSLFRSE